MYSTNILIKKKKKKKNGVEGGERKKEKEKKNYNIFLRDRFPSLPALKKGIQTVGSKPTEDGTRDAKRYLKQKLCHVCKAHNSCSFSSLDDSAVCPGDITPIISAK